MDLPADQSTRTRASRLQPPPTAPLRAPRRRRPSGEAPPLPHHLHTTGVGWLVASVVLVALSMVVFAGGLRGPAVAVTVLDDAVVRWLAGLDAPWLVRSWEALAFLGSWWILNTLGWGQDPPGSPALSEASPVRCRLKALLAGPKPLPQPDQSPDAATA